ncbi:MAG: DUF1786 family protein [Candidatus Muiribacteriota bacterium]
MIFTVDIGTGTQDIMLYDSEERFKENLIKMIFPSYSLKFFKRVKSLKGDIFVSGMPIGGGPFKKALKKHLEKGYKVALTPLAAKTVRDSKEEVLSKGFEILEKNPGYANEICLGEFDIDFYQKIFDYFDKKWDKIDKIAIACQDHGFRDLKGTEREFRLDFFQKSLKKNSDVRSFLYHGDNIPDTFIRMNSIAEHIRNQGFKKDIFLMDTVFAACIGVTESESFDNSKFNLILNFGNSHTLGIIIKEYKIYALFEHHTRFLNKKVKLEELINKFIEKNLNSKEVMTQEGHGAIYMCKDFDYVNNIYVTGPRREIAHTIKKAFIKASPWGDMMITGNIGLIKAVSFFCN